MTVLRWAGRHVATIGAVVAIVVASYAVYRVDTDARGRDHRSCVERNKARLGSREIFDGLLNRFGAAPTDKAFVHNLLTRTQPIVECPR